MIAAAAFYVFAAILIGSAAAVVTSRNPVHSVLFLILAFLNAAALFLLAGAEFLALILVIVYVGAVAVLFLFVVMMLDINFAELRSGYQKYAPIGAAVGAILFVELLLILNAWPVSPAASALRTTPIPNDATNTVALGRVLYTQYILLFQTAGLVLLVAMIGAIVLTLRGKQQSRRQSIEIQQARMPADTVSMMDVRIGAGVQELGILRAKVTEPADDDDTPELVHGPGHGHDH